MVSALFENMKRYVGFGDGDIEALASLREPLVPFLPEIVDQFYGVITRHGEARKTLTGGPDQLAQLHKTLLQWLRDLFSGDYGPEYCDRRCDIGRAHVRVDLPQAYMFTAMNRVRLALVRKIESLRLKGAPRKIAALHKILDLELAIMNNTYREDDVRRIQEFERAQYKQRLSESEHMARIGQLAASLAHEIKNPLAGISGAIQVLGSGLEANHPHKEIITEALQQIDRLDAAVKDLLVYARPKPPEKTKQSLKALLERVLILLREEPAFRAVRVHREGLDGDCEVVVDEAQMQQVLANLMLNAAHACEQGGDVTCRVKPLPSRLTVEIEDNGIGMPKEVFARVFEPFFTTKARGTGLGLPICKRIIEAHGGTIEVHSRVGKGTRVTFEIPNESWPNHTS